jgi:hypothetical protein
MIIRYGDNEELDIPVNDESYRYRAIRGEHSLTLHYSLAEHVEIPLGAQCEFEGETYVLERPENFQMLNTRNFEYTLIMESAQAKLSKYKFKDVTSGRLKFSLTSTPRLHLQMLVDNMNLRETGWELGSYIEATEKVISYNHAFCIDALNQMADEFETEWEIVGKKIHLRKIEYNKDNPLPLSYGRGHGFRSGIGRTADGARPVERLYVQGGERNIDSSKYGSNELLLPKNQSLVYEGRTYVSDSDGFSIRRGDKALWSNAEDSLDCSHIYPSRVGSVTGVEVVDADNHFYDFFDSTIPNDLDFGQCRMAGEKITIIFQTGVLTGKEFDIEQNDEETNSSVVGYVHSERRFKLVPVEMDGRVLPDELFRPAIGDKYAVFGIMMPAAYICDNATKTGASWDMFREAAKYLYENEEQKFTFTGELDGIWAKKDWVNIGGRIKLGAYILFSDNQFQPDGVLIRIVGIKDYINNPHSPSIELSNGVVGSTVISDLRKIASNEVVVDDLRREALQFTKRRYRDSLETIYMLESALLEHYTNAIQPIAVRTMAMLVGDEGLQFRFVNSMTNPVEVGHNVVYNQTTKILSAPAGIIQHMTLGITTLSSTHAVNEYKFWSLPAYSSAALAEGEKKYYLYAKVSKSATTGVFLLSETAIAMEGVAGYYHLLMGALNSEYDGERSYASLYGFSEVLPGQLTTNKVVSSDGRNYIDFLNNAARIGNANTYIDFNSAGDGVLRLKGSLVQSSSGSEFPVGCYRGVYNSSYTYYKGDEVTWNGTTYLYINNTATSNVAPSNTTYWTVYAQKGNQGDKGDKGADGATGKDGKDGASYWTWVRYADDASGNGISDSPAGKYYVGFAVNKTTETESNNPADYLWSLLTAEEGVTGPPGADGQTMYIWVKYSDHADGTGMYDVPTSTTEYIGIAVNKTTATEGTNKADYTWSHFRGGQGVPGPTGPYYENRYAKNGSMTSPPALTVTDANPSGWSVELPALNEGEYLWVTKAKRNGDGTVASNWDEPIRMPFGGKGDPGTSIIYRGWYDDTKTYRGTGQFVDIVRNPDDELFYIARTDAGEFVGKDPTDTNYWNSFGASFESVATHLLLADMAYIADWIIKDGKLTSQSSTGSVPNAQLNGVTGSLVFVSESNSLRQYVTLNGMGLSIAGVGPGITIDKKGLEVGRIRLTQSGLEVGGILVNGKYYSGGIQVYVDSGNSAATKVFVGNLPQSSTGLYLNQLWRDGDTLKIKLTGDQYMPPHLNS